MLLIILYILHIKYYNIKYLFKKYNFDSQRAGKKKEQSKSKVTKKQEIIKTRGKINKIHNRKPKEKNQTELFF